MKYDKIIQLIPGIIIILLIIASCYFKKSQIAKQFNENHARFILLSIVTIIIVFILVFIISKMFV